MHGTTSLKKVIFSVCVIPFTKITKKSSEARLNDNSRNDIQMSEWVSTRTS